MISYGALSWDVTTLRSSKGKVGVTDGPFAETKEQIGSFFIFEARDMAEAISVASRHPSARMGEDLDWRIELRPFGEFKPEWRADGWRAVVLIVRAFAGEQLTRRGLRR